MPFGLKAPSRGTVIFGTVVATISGGIYASNYYATQSRRRLFDQVSWLAERPCGVHEMPRKVAVYLTAPPGDSLEKSRAWFRDYVKPVLVAGAVDYELKEASTPGQIEAAVCEEIVNRRRAAKLAEDKDMLSDPSSQNPFAPMMTDVFKKQAEQVQVDGMLAIGRNTWKEVLSGLSKGCTSSLEPAPAPTTPDTSDTPNTSDSPDVADTPDTPDTLAMTETFASPNVATDAPYVETEQKEASLPKEEHFVPAEPTHTEIDMAVAPQDKEEIFALPPAFPPVVYIPHENIIGWTNIPYRLYMWFADYQRIERVGHYVVAAVLNKTRPLALTDVDVGLQEKVYWIGEDAEQDVKDDVPVVADERIRNELQTYVVESS